VSKIEDEQIWSVPNEKLALLDFEQVTFQGRSCPILLDLFGEEDEIA